MPQRALIALTLLLLLSAIHSPAQDSELPPISPDRPDFTNGADIVPLGTLQLESGVSYTAADTDHEVGAGELNLRVPVSRRLEFSLQVGSYVRDSAGNEATSGVTDGAVGCKIRVFDGFPTASGRSPRLAVVLLTSLPTGSDAFRGPGMQPQATLAADIDLAPEATLSANVGVMEVRDREDRHLQAYGGASLGFGLGGAWSGFLELFAWRPGSAADRTRRVVDAGLQLLLGNDIMLDAHVGRTAGDGPASTSAGLGVALRW